MAHQRKMMAEVVLINAQMFNERGIVM